MASTTIGQLRVALGLDSAQFDRGARRAGSSLDNMRKQFKMVAAAAAVFAAAVGGAAMRGARQIDEAAKAARRLGTSVGGFRALELAADEAGVSVTALTDDIQSMLREVANIGTSGNAKRALDKLGIAVADIAGEETDEKIAMIADRVKELGLSAGEATALLRDLGVRNRAMVLLMLQGGGAIRAARDDMRDYGLALSDVDTSRIEAANDAIGRLGLVGKYLAQQLALEIVPALGAMAKAMTDSLREGGVLRGVIDAVAGSIQRVGSYAAAAVIVFGGRLGLSVAIRAAATAVGVLSGSLTVLKGAILRTGIGIAIVAVGEAIYWFGQLVEKTGGVGEAFNALKRIIYEVFDRIGIAFESGWLAFQALVLHVTAGALTIAADIADLIPGIDTMVAVFSAGAAIVKEAWSGLVSIIEGVDAAIKSVLGNTAEQFKALDQEGTDLFERLRISREEFERSGFTGGGGQSDMGGGAGDDTLQGGAGDDRLKDSETRTAAYLRENAALAERAAYLKAMEAMRKSVAAGRTLDSLKVFRDLTSDAVDEADDLRTKAGEVAETLAGATTPAVSGLNSALRETVTEAANADDELDELSDSAADFKSGITSAFRSVISGAKSAGEAIKEFFNTLLQNLAARIFEQNIADPLARAFGKLLSSMGGGKNFFSGLFSAKGNAFNSSGVMAFANGGIVNSPTLFPFANGTGLMGEAGPEAIMPLARDSRGRLGVHGGGGGGQVVNVNVATEPGLQATATESESNGMRNIEIQITRAVANNIASGGVVATSLKRVYGLNPSLSGR